MLAQHRFGVEVGQPITSEDVLRIRSEVFPDMRVSQEEAEQFFSLNDNASGSCPEWRALFVEALTDYLVRQADPVGYVGEARAAWLIDRITRDGKIKTGTEFELLIRVLELSTEAPSQLKNLALSHAHSFALSETRSAGQGHKITAAEVASLRRILYATAGDGGGWAVTRREAALLFAINDLSRGQDNAPEWRTLFVQGIGSALLAGNAYRPPSRDEALRRQAWLEAPAQGVGSFLGRMARTAVGGGHRADGDALYEAYAAHDKALDYAIADAERLTEEESEWLYNQIGRDGVFDDNEKALLRFVAEEAVNPPPAIQRLLDRLKLSGA